MIRYSGQPFFFAPAPVLYHLRCETGGTRHQDYFLSSISPNHSVGDYYFAIKEGRPYEAFSYCLKRLFGSARARFYLRKPWYLPVRFIAECRGFLLALRPIKQGPKYCQNKQAGK